MNPDSAVGSIEKGNVESFRCEVDRLLLLSTAVTSKFNVQKHALRLAERVQGGERGR
jgi:hypothetical protein